MGLLNYVGPSEKRNCTTLTWANLLVLAFAIGGLPCLKPFGLFGVPRGLEAFVETRPIQKELTQTVSQDSRNFQNGDAVLKSARIIRVCTLHVKS